MLGLEFFPFIVRLHTRLYLTYDFQCVNFTLQQVYPCPFLMQVIRLSAAKSVAAGIAGAALTNPIDVIRNEMFKTEEVRRRM